MMDSQVNGTGPGTDSGTRTGTGTGTGTNAGHCSGPALALALSPASALAKAPAQRCSRHLDHHLNVGTSRACSSIATSALDQPMPAEVGRLSARAGRVASPEALPTHPALVPVSGTPFTRPSREEHLQEES